MASDDRVFGVVRGEAEFAQIGETARWRPGGRRRRRTSELYRGGRLDVEFLEQGEIFVDEWDKPLKVAKTLDDGG